MIWSHSPYLMLSVNRALPSLRTHARWRTAVTRHSVIGAVEGGARATSVKQINARRQITKRVSRLIATAAASSFISPPQISTRERRNSPRTVCPVDAGRSVAQAPVRHSPFLYLTRHVFRGLWVGKFSVALAHVQNLTVFPRVQFKFSARPCSCNCICAQRVIWCSAAGEWRVHNLIGVGLNSPISCKDYAPTSFIGKA